MKVRYVSPVHKEHTVMSTVLSSVEYTSSEGSVRGTVGFTDEDLFGIAVIRSSCSIEGTILQWTPLNTIAGNRVSHLPE